MTALEHDLDYAFVEGWEQRPAGYTYRGVSDISCDSQDNVYLLARLDGQVLVFDPTGRFLRAWGHEAFSIQPHGITVAPDDTVYVVDAADDTVKQFTNAGQLLRTIGLSAYEAAGVPLGSRRGGDIAASPELRSKENERLAKQPKLGPFNRPTGLVVAANGDLYISDGYGNSRVHHYSSTGDLIRSWGEPGTDPGQFHTPHAITIDRQGRILVSDRENDRIQVFTPSGDFIEEWTDLQRPCAAEVTPDGLVFVPELARVEGEQTFKSGTMTTHLPSRLTVLDSNGRVIRRFGGTDRDPCSVGELTCPHGIGVDSKGNAYVAEIPYARMVKRTTGEAASITVDNCHRVQKLAPGSTRDAGWVTRMPAPNL